MRRREFIAGLGSAAAWPAIGHAQRSAPPVIGYLGSSSPDTTLTIAHFTRGLKEAGYVEGQNVAIEYRWANNQYDRLPTLATDLVSRQVTVIAAPPPVVVALAAKAATQIIPIVFLTAADPITTGLVTSLNRPNGNITGVAAFDGTLAPKNIELLNELIPKAKVIGLLFNPDVAITSLMLPGANEAAQIFGSQLVTIAVRDEDDIDFAFERLRQMQISAVYIFPDAFLYSERDRLIARAASCKIAVVSNFRDFPAAGGLASYGAKNSDLFRQFGACVGKILGGAKPSDVPVSQPTAFELVINLKAAKALGIDVPPSLIARADEVIE
jgi:putative ABC transport system substrate-binding protein